MVEQGGRALRRAIQMLQNVAGGPDGTEEASRTLACKWIEFSYFWRYNELLLNQLYNVKVVLSL